MFPILKEIEQWFGSDSLDQRAIRIGQKTGMSFDTEEVGRLVEGEEGDGNQLCFLHSNVSLQTIGVHLGVLTCFSEMRPGFWALPIQIDISHGSLIQQTGQSKYSDATYSRRMGSNGKSRKIGMIECGCPKAAFIWKNVDKNGLFADVAWW